MNWSKTDIRAARKIPLAPILQRRGVRLRELPGQNFRVDAYGDLTIRDCYWIWKTCPPKPGEGGSRTLQGNTIDFFIMVENLSFAEAMKLLLGSN